MQLAGVVEFVAVQRNQGSASENLIGLHGPVFAERLEGDVEARMQVGAVDAVELPADVIVGRQWVNAEQGTAGMPAVRAGGHAPVLEERGRLHEEYREGRHQDVVKSILPVASTARVPDVAEDPEHAAEQVVNQRPHALRPRLP